MYTPMSSIHTDRHRISDARLINLFKGPSPLSRRTIRHRLGSPPRAVVSAVLSSAEKRGVLERCRPSDLGSNRHRLHVYKLAFLDQLNIWLN